MYSKHGKYMQHYMRLAFTHINRQILRWRTQDTESTSNIWVKIILTFQNSSIILFTNKQFTRVKIT